MSSMRFTDKGIEDAERDFSQLDILPIHRKMIEEVADVLLVYIDISRLALMGFAWRAIRKWQVDNQMTTVEITKEPLSRRCEQSGKCSTTWNRA